MLPPKNPSSCNFPEKLRNKYYNFLKRLCHRWAQVTGFLVIENNELNGRHREFIAERGRTDLLSDSTLHRTWELASNKQRLTAGAGGILVS